MSSRPTNRPMFKFERYATANGQRALSVTTHLKDFAALYDAEWNKDYMKVNFRRLYKDTNEWIPQRFETYEQMRQYMSSYVIPAKLRQIANRASTDLADIFQEVAAIKLLRDQEVGLLDPHKMPALVGGLMTNTYNPEDVMPYMQVQSTPSKRPTIGLVASLGNAEMHSDTGYVARIGALVLGVAWACEAAGLDLYAAITQGAASLNPVGEWAGIQQAIHPFYLAHPHDSVSPRCFSSVLSAATWQTALIAANLADKPNYTRMMGLFGHRSTPNAGRGFLSYDGGNAVDWMRQQHQADVVIAVNKITDIDAADIRLGKQFDLNSAVKEIAAQARKLVR